MGLPEIVVVVLIGGIFALLLVCAAIWAFKQIRLAIKSKTVSLKLVIAVLVLLFVAYTLLTIILTPEIEAGTVVPQLRQFWILSTGGEELDGRALHAAVMHGRLC